MNFALIGDHPDGLGLARAVAESERHRLLVYRGPPGGDEMLQRWGVDCERSGDAEEILTDPQIHAVIIAAGAGNRFPLVRRAIQEEIHVVSVHPLDATPDAAYEAAMLAREKRVVLLPLLAEVVHPCWDRLAKLIALDRARQLRGGGSAPRLVRMERWSTNSPFLDADKIGHPPGFPGWDILRYLAGEIVEVSAFSQWLEAGPEDPLFLHGCFEKGGIFQSTFIPRQAESRLQLTLLMHDSSARVDFPDGWPGPARLSWRDENGQDKTEHWDSFNPWPAMLSVIEQAVAVRRRPVKADDAHARESVVTLIPSWRDEIRCAELDDAARRSLARRRSSTLEYQEAVEEASFKGTMTLAGCGILWLSVLLLILSIWIPYLGWVIIPIFAIFLLLQILRWVVLPAHSEPRQHKSNPVSTQEHQESIQSLRR